MTPGVHFRVCLCEFQLYKRGRSIKSASRMPWGEWGIVREHGWHHHAYMDTHSGSLVMVQRAVQNAGVEVSAQWNARHDA